MSERLKRIAMLRERIVFIRRFYLWYSTGKHNYKQQNRPAYNKEYVNKAARKAG
ncbi:MULTISPECIES: hypothetical protein [unclassified Bacillus (in: firmicutes)]|uniref:hypothetical protein n=1 Tax=unclassified Bacillus (in: firmicutes) TaxID=185979 RepID=UPI001F5B43D6|nr:MULTISPECIES: hypothetical protein [unclassified Bacillus (in: firmicutes)]